MRPWPTPELDIVICPRIGGARGLPTGTQTADCLACWRPVWVIPKLQRVQLKTGARPMCGPCYERLHGGMR
jgi:hypothetical protein